MQLQNNFSMPDKAQYHVTPVRPGNFGEHVDHKVNIDNFFEENRAWNEEDTSIRRTQAYIVNAVFYGAMLSYARIFALTAIQRISGWTRYDRDTYAEFDISSIPPGKKNLLFTHFTFWCFPKSNFR